MSLPDATASAALGGAVVKPIWFVYLDFLGDPFRANTSGYNVNIAGSGQPDLDGTYDGVSHKFVEISDIKVQPGGSDTVTAKLSNLPGLDDAMRAYLADRANWQGRVARMWRIIRNGDGVQQGGVQHYYTGYMMSLSHASANEQLTIRLTIESYLAAFTAPSNRTYQHQGEFDELDLSPAAAAAIANGNNSSSLIGGAGNGGWGQGGGGFGGAGGGGRGLYVNVREF